MLKNRYFSIQLENDEKTTYLLRVKKDFYTEGINTQGEEILQGYFYLYKNINLNILDSKDETSTICSHHGMTGDNKSGISFVTLDEELISYGIGNKILFLMEEIDEKSELAKKIDYLLRNSIKGLSSNNKKIYDYFATRRMSFFRDFKSEATTPIYQVGGEEYVVVDDQASGITRDDLGEIEKYLESITQPQPISKGKDESGKKLRKRKKNSKS